MGTGRSSNPAAGAANAMREGWPSVLRIVVGLYWLYFASQKWQGLDWMHGLMRTAANVNPIPGLHEFLLNVVVPNWFLFALAQSIAETVVAVLLILGLATRVAGILGLLLATNLALTVGFATGDSGFQWMYFLGVLVSAQVIVSGAGPLALDRFRWVPSYLR
jgi:uncharacterized membrane protein YphA (DoxX/SURF4 family)